MRCIIWGGLNLESLIKVKEMKSRRDFLKEGGIVLVVGAVYGTYMSLSGCTKGGISPFAPYRVDENLCVGCGDCFDHCDFDAIHLPRKSRYSIVEEKCTDCKKCVPTCPQEAIFIAGAEYFILKDNCLQCDDCIPYCPENAIKIPDISYSANEETCFGCGVCITACQQKGSDCITYEKEDYSVKNKCKNQVCNNECISACPEGAITKAGTMAVIDTGLCTRCGLCGAACPYDAINPAKVVINEDDCTRCGACYSACEAASIDREILNGITEPYIDKTACTNCGDCIDHCTHDAICKTEPTPGEFSIIDEEKCNACGKCVLVCEDDAIHSEIYKATIITEACRECGECIDFSF